MSDPWLTIIGMGDDGPSGLSPQACTALKEADTIVASRRLLDMLQPSGADHWVWQSPLSDTIARIVAHRGTPTTVIATGDPMHFGAANTLLGAIPIGEMRILPSPSAFSLAAARLGWTLQDCECVSLHGRNAARIVRHFQPGNRIIALTGDGSTIGEVAGLLCARGFAQSRIVVMEHMGGAAEKRHDLTADTVGKTQFSAFNTLGVECRIDEKAAFHPTTPGLSDDAFVHDGKMTKREVRAVTLSRLMPYPHALLWDVGAGCGSVCVEWLRAARGAKAIAIEPNEDRRAMIAENAVSLGVPELRIVAGSAPAALEGLEPPDAVFIGGGLTQDGLVETCWDALRPGGIMVANAVTLEGEARLIALSQTHGGELSRIAVSRAEAVGAMRGWRPMMPVTIWLVQKAGARS